MIENLSGIGYVTETNVRDAVTPAKGSVLPNEDKLTN